MCTLDGVPHDVRTSRKVGFTPATEIGTCILSISSKPDAFTLNLYVYEATRLKISATFSEKTASFGGLRLNRFNLSTHFSRHVVTYI